MEEVVILSFLWDNKYFLCVCVFYGVFGKNEQKSRKRDTLFDVRRIFYTRTKVFFCAEVIVLLYYWKHGKIIYSYSWPVERKRLQDDNPVFCDDWSEHLLSVRLRKFSWVALKLLPRILFKKNYDKSTHKHIFLSRPLQTIYQIITFHIFVMTNIFLIYEHFQFKSYNFKVCFPSYTHKNMEKVSCFPCKRKKNMHIMIILDCTTINNQLSCFSI